MGEYFTCAQLVAGALLKFDSIDSIDISILLQDIKEKLGIECDRSWNIHYENDVLKRVIEFDDVNGEIGLCSSKRNGVITKEERKWLEKLLKEAAGEKLTSYFQPLYISDYKAKKRNAIREYQDSELQNARVLLLSELNEDYNTLLHLGYKKINWFKSIKRANAFFGRSLRALGNYDIIVIGQCVLNVQKNSMINKIRKIPSTRNIAIVDINRESFPYTDEIDVWIRDRVAGRSRLVRAKDESDIGKAIRECALVNHLLDNKASFANFKEISDRINDNKIPLPEHIHDLNVLWVDGNHCQKYIENCAKDIGLNVTVARDTDTAMENIVQCHLGEYDIILASDAYSGHLLEMVNECNEQCKETGRRKVLLATYNFEPFCYSPGKSYFERNDASSIQLSYIYYGSKRVDIDYGRIHSLLNQHYVTQDNVKTIMCGLIEIYNRMLKAYGKSIENVDFPNITYLEREYKLYCGYVEVVMLVRNILDKKKQDEGDIELSDGYYVCQQSNKITISGIYDGERRTIPIYIQDDGRFSSLEHSNKKMSELFLTEVIERLKKLGKEEEKKKVMTIIEEDQL